MNILIFVIGFEVATLCDAIDDNTQAKTIKRVKALLLSKTEVVTRSRGLYLSGPPYYEPITYNNGLVCQDTFNNKVFSMCPGTTTRDCYTFGQSGCHAYGTKWGDGDDDIVDGDNGGLTNSNVRYSVCCNYGGSGQCNTPGDSGGGGDQRCCPSTKCTRTLDKYTLPPSVSPTASPTTASPSAAPTNPTVSPTSSPTTLAFLACESRVDEVDCLGSAASGRCQWAASSSGGAATYSLIHSDTTCDTSDTEPAASGWAPDVGGWYYIAGGQSLADCQALCDGLSSWGCTHISSNENWCYVYTTCTSVDTGISNYDVYERTPADPGDCTCINSECSSPGWPVYYTWGNDVSACPCSHQSVPQYVGGILIDSGEGCHDILTKDDCLAAFGQLYPTLPTPVFHGHIDDPNVPRGCAWTENVVFGSHGAPSFLINYHDTGSTGSYGHTVLCQNHDYEYPDDVYLPLFDPTSEWIEYTSNDCGPGHVGGERTSSGVCSDIVIDGVNYINYKIQMISVPATEGSVGGSLMEKVTMDGCEYYGWKIHHCVASADTRSPTTTSPSASPSAAPTSPTAVPTEAPTVTIPDVQVITTVGGSCVAALRPSEAECMAIQRSSANDPNCPIGGLNAGACTENTELWGGHWPWIDVTPPLYGVPSGCIVHDNGGSQYYFYNTGTTGETTGNSNYEVCIDITDAPSSAPSSAPTSPTAAPSSSPTTGAPTGAPTVTIVSVEMAFTTTSIVPQSTITDGGFVVDTLVSTCANSCTALCDRSDTTCATTRRRRLTTTTITFTVGSSDISAVSALLDDATYGLVVTGMALTVTTSAETLGGVFSILSAASITPTITSLTVDDSGPSAGLDSAFNMIASALTGAGISTASVPIAMSSSPGTPAVLCASDEIRYNEQCLACSALQTATQSACPGNGPSTWPSGCTPYVCTSAPTTAPSNAPTYDPALYWQFNEFYPKTDGTCAEACNAHVPNSVTGIESDDPNLCGEDEFPY